MTVERQIELDRTPKEVWPLVLDGRWLGSGDDLGGGVGSRAAVWTDEGLRNLEIHTVQAPRKLGFRWWPADRPSDATEVAVEVEPREGGERTRVTVVESPPASVQRPIASARAQLVGV